MFYFRFMSIRFAFKSLVNFHLKLFIQFIQLLIQLLISFMKHLTFNDILFNDIITYVFSIFKDFCNKIANEYKHL